MYMKKNYYDRKQIQVEFSAEISAPPPPPRGQKWVFNCVCLYVLVRCCRFVDSRLAQKLLDIQARLDAQKALQAFSCGV